ncbi:hypothetical protein BJ912DRAFT_1138043 [Pholiota molesta]|nr:hypothetical protein BJ912DRAFT_1138043 [Pholiota molesta]
MEIPGYYFWEWPESPWAQQRTTGALDLPGNDQFFAGGSFAIPRDFLFYPRDRFTPKRPIPDRFTPSFNWHGRLSHSQSLCPGPTAPTTVDANDDANDNTNDNTDEDAENSGARAPRRRCRKAATMSEAARHSWRWDPRTSRRRPRPPPTSAVTSLLAPAFSSHRCHPPLAACPSPLTGMWAGSPTTVNPNADVNDNPNDNTDDDADNDRLQHAAARPSAPVPHPAATTTTNERCSFVCLFIGCHRLLQPSRCGHDNYERAALARLSGRLSKSKQVGASARATSTTTASIIPTTGNDVHLHRGPSPPTAHIAISPTEASGSR